MPTAVTERLDSPRILAGTTAELRVTISQDGTPVDITAGFSVALTNADTAATITPAASVAEEATGKLVMVLTGAETATPQRIKAVWSATIGGNAMTFTTYHEIVGDVLFNIAEARATDQATLADAERYPQLAILEARDVIAEAFEDICGVSFGTRGTREIVDGDGTAGLWLERMQCQAVSAAATRASGGSTWTALTAGEITGLQLYPHGRLVRESGSWPWGYRNVRVDYTHGHARVPGEIKRAALVVLRDQLPGTNLTNRALSQTNELGTFRISAPGERGKWFGIPIVDEALSRYSLKLPGVA